MEAVMCKRLTIYSVPGPSSSPGLLQEKIDGGWAYALENLEFLLALNPDCQLEAVFGHVKEFGPIPSIPSYSRIKLHVYETSLKELSDLAFVETAQQHGAILNYILKTHHLETPFYAILDPDCYIVKKNALHHLIDHMLQVNLDMIGVSYPTTLPKVYYWDFPTAYFQLMDRKNCEPASLDFLPAHTALAAGTGVSNAKSAPFAKTFRHTAKLVKIFRIPVKKVMQGSKDSRFGIFQSVFYFYTNYIYRNTPLFRDTGWKNRKLYNQLNLEIIPHRVKPLVLNIRLNEAEYLLENQDIRESGINPTWHALMHGIYEKREFGRQSWRWTFLNKLLGNGMLSSKNFPATSIVMASSILHSINFDNGVGNFKHSYEYFWKSEPFCIHLGHGGKEESLTDVSRLASMRAQIINSSGNWSSDGSIRH
jgi:hypothetical protein